MPRSDEDAQRRPEIGNRDESKIKPQENLRLCQLCVHYHPEQMPTVCTVSKTLQAPSVAHNWVRFALDSRDGRHERLHPPLRVWPRCQDMIRLHDDRPEQRRGNEDPELQVAQDVLDVHIERSHGLTMAKELSRRREALGVDPGVRARREDGHKYGRVSDDVKVE